VISLLAKKYLYYLLLCYNFSTEAQVPGINPRVYHPYKGVIHLDLNAASIKSHIG
jgi:hypothetical protein